jgi:DNA/RNA-binding domain of Phe-tRNA-synthetase-like protein
MIFSVTPDCHELGLRAGAVVFRDVNIGPAGPALRAEIQREIEAIRTRYADAQAIRSNPEVGFFGDLLRKVGANPRREQPSVEKLLNFALKRGDLPAINSLVDAYNLVSVRTLCSLGAHDLDLIATPVRLTMLSGGESFVPLGGQTPVPVAAGEYGYVDGQDRLLCRLDVLQAEFSKVTNRTTNALLIIEATASHAADLVKTAFTEAVERVTRHCGGTAEVVAMPQL